MTGDGSGGGGNWPTAAHIVVMGGTAQTVGGGRDSLAAAEPVGDGETEETEEEMVAVGEYPDFYHTLSKQQRKYWRRRNLRK
jgi:hypothetical protein